MSRRLRRWIALLMLGLLGFAQAGVALAACLADRGEMAGMASAPAHGAAGHACCEDGDRAPGPPTNICVAHCTSDLQAFGWASFAVPRVAALVIAVIPRASIVAVWYTPAEAPPPRIPPRILLHSYLV